MICTILILEKTKLFEIYVNFYLPKYKKIIHVDFTFSFMM